MVVIGVLHTLAGLLTFHSSLWAIAREGFVNTVAGQAPERSTTLWFMLTGFGLLLIGGLTDELERRGEPLPAFLRWSLLAIGVGVAVILPVSGAWFFFVPAAGQFWRSRSGTTAAVTGNAPGQLTHSGSSGRGEQTTQG